MLRRKRPRQGALHLVFDRCILPIVRRTKQKSSSSPTRKRFTPASLSDKGAAPEAVENPPGESSGGKEIGGPDGPEPTRYGDWERNGRCIDF
jgi:hypothetical protein